MFYLYTPTWLETHLPKQRGEELSINVVTGFHQIQSWDPFLRSSTTTSLTIRNTSIICLPPTKACLEGDMRSPITLCSPSAKTFAKNLYILYQTDGSKPFDVSSARLLRMREMKLSYNPKLKLRLWTLGSGRFATLQKHRYSCCLMSHDFRCVNFLPVIISTVLAIYQLYHLCVVCNPKKLPLG